jgi:hypothetical protein
LSFGSWTLFFFRRRADARGEKKEAFRRGWGRLLSRSCGPLVVGAEGLVIRTVLLSLTVTLFGCLALQRKSHEWSHAIFAGRELNDAYLRFVVFLELFLADFFAFLAMCAITSFLVRKS